MHDDEHSDAPGSEPSHQPHVGETVALSPTEARVMGCLVEKQFLTPDIYPMTTNALVAACNQKTNREPVVAFDAVVVDQALMALRQRKLVRMVHTPGARSTKHRHTLDEALNLDKGELALLSVLLLRGAQTVGELRGRTERHHGFESLESTDACLRRLAGRQQPLVVEREREPGHKERRWMHLIDDGSEPTQPDESTPAEPGFSAVQAATDLPADGSPSSVVRSAPDHGGALSAPHPDVSAAQNSGRTDTASADSTSLHARVEVLEAQLAALASELTELRSSLGESL